jgi:hypothetical protein
MPSGRPWTALAQYAGFRPPRRQCFATKSLPRRAKGLSVAFGIPPPTAATTAIIRASTGDVGRVAVARRRVSEDMKIVRHPARQDERVDDDEPGCGHPLPRFYIVAAERGVLRR